MSPRRRAGGRRFGLRYAGSTADHLRALTARQRAIVVDAIEERLRAHNGDAKPQADG